MKVNAPHCRTWDRCHDPLPSTSQKTSRFGWYGVLDPRNADVVYSLVPVGGSPHNS
jgi:hypothetical protein